MPQEVVFSNRAYTALLSETLGKITTETGGIFLGTFENDKWYIIESIDPGPKSIFSVAYFEYDETYVNHLANKINILYKKPLQIMGLWHRHPGSMDYFSSTDNGTHEKYANINPFGVISALVNIDPVFRISIYHITRSAGRLFISKNKLPSRVGDEHIPANLLEYKSAAFLQDKIKYNTLWRTETRRNNKYFPLLIKKIFSSNVDIVDMQNMIVKSVPVNDDDIEKILEAFEKDFAFFEKHHITCNMLKTKENILKFYGENEQDKNSCFEVFMYNNNVYIRHNQRTLPYKPEMFLKAFK